MQNAGRMMRVSFLISMIGFLVSATPVSGAEVSPLVPKAVSEEKAPVQVKVYPIEKITKEQFNALPDSALIEIKGRRISKGQLRSELKQDAKKKMAEAWKKRDKFEAVRAKFLAEQKAKRDANNAKMHAEMASFRKSDEQRTSQIEVIRHEANQLQDRYPKATPQEKAQIEKRAGELARQLKQFGY